MKAPINELTRNEIFIIIKEIQENNPRDSITKKQVAEKSGRSYSSIQRAFRDLYQNDMLIKEKRGQYWVKEYYEKNIDYLKRANEWSEEFWSHVDTLYVDEIRKLRQENEELFEIITRYEEDIARKEYLHARKIVEQTLRAARHVGGKASSQSVEFQRKRREEQIEFLELLGIKTKKKTQKDK